MANTKIVIEGEVFFSKTYTTTANIAAASIATERFINEEDELGNSPFDVIVIDNIDTVDLAVRLDYSPTNRIIVPNTSSKAIKGLSFKNYTIENLDAANVHTAGKIFVQVLNTKDPRKK